MIEFENVTKKYGSKVAIKDVTTVIEAGSIVGLLGPNGSGKTTLLKLLLHIIRPNEGKMLINGEEIDYETRRFISYMPDREFLYDTMNVQDAINYYKDMFDDFSEKRSQELCNKLKIDTTLDIKKLSKGNKEKVNLMLTLSRVTSIYLLDEPLGSLDPVVKNDMLTAIKEFKRDDAIILIATHLIKDTESILDKVIFLKEGEIVVQETKANIKKKKKTLDKYYLEVFS